VRGNAACNAAGHRLTTETPRTNGDKGDQSRANFIVLVDLSFDIDVRDAADCPLQTATQRMSVSVVAPPAITLVITRSPSRSNRRDEGPRDGPGSAACSVKRSSRLGRAPPMRCARRRNVGWGTTARAGYYSTPGLCSRWTQAERFRCPPGAGSDPLVHGRDSPYQAKANQGRGKRNKVFLHTLCTCGC
jgi:hypothetical protein